MRAFPCRCRKCGHRRTLRQEPDRQRCYCGGTFRVDWYRRNKEHKRTNCRCSAYPWSISNGPHRRGSPLCYYRSSGES